MEGLFKKIKHKVNSLIVTLVSTGVIMLILAVLIVWTDLVLRLVIGLLAVVLAYSFFYSAYKIWHFKREIEKHFKL